MQFLLSSIWIGLELLCCLVFISGFQVCKRKKTICIVTFFLAWVAMVIYTNTEINEIFKQFITFTIFVGVCAFLYDGKILLHLLLVLVCYIFLGLIDTACAYGVCVLLGITFSDFVWLKFTYITVTTISKLLALLFAWLIKRTRASGGIHGIQKKWLILLLLFPAVSMILLVCVFFGSQDSEDMSLNAVIVSTVLAVANFALIYIISAIEKASKIENETKMLKQQIAFQAENYRALQKSYTLQRKTTHEFEHHLQTLGDLLNRMEVQTSIDYINLLQSNSTLRTQSVNSHHAVIDVILNQKYQLAKESNIKMQIQVSDLSDFTIPTDEIVVLLSNLLDNAIEACKKIDTRREIFCSIVSGDMVYISVRNTTLPVKIEDGIFPTSKCNTSEHGYGIPAIRYILDELHAEYTFDYRDGWFQFVAEIPK